MKPDTQTVAHQTQCCDSNTLKQLCQKHSVGNYKAKWLWWIKTGNPCALQCSKQQVRHLSRPKVTKTRLSCGHMTWPFLTRHRELDTVSKHLCRASHPQCLLALLVCADAAFSVRKERPSVNEDKAEECARHHQRWHFVLTLIIMVLS